MSSRETAERYFDTQGKGDIEGALACFNPDAEFVGPMGSLPFPDGVRAYLQGFQSSFPGSYFEVNNAIEAGDQAVIEGFGVGKHTGTLHLPDGKAIPATNRGVRASFVTIFRVENDHIVSHRGYWDMAGFMAKLGLG